MFAFENTAVADVKIMALGKATRYYPLDEQAFQSCKIIRMKLPAETNSCRQTVVCTVGFACY
jgi:hypothetical protein